MITRSGIAAGTALLLLGPLLVACRSDARTSAPCLSAADSGADAVLYAKALALAADSGEFDPCVVSVVDTTGDAAQRAISAVTDGRFPSNPPVQAFTMTGSFSTDGVEDYPVMVMVYTRRGALVEMDIRADEPDFE